MAQVPYFCTKCSKEVSKLNELLFVEENSTKGFCSNECILKFYSPYMEFFTNFESKVREQLNLNFDELYHHLYQDKELFDQVLFHPESTHLYESEIGVFYYLHEKKMGDKYYLAVCTHYDDEPAFVYYKLITESDLLVQEFIKLFSSLKKEKKDDGIMTNITLNEDLMNDINLKKSEQLALLLSRRSVEDIDYTKFENYADCVESTLSEPDETYEYEDEQSDTIVTYIKSFKRHEEEFYYVLLCQRVEIKDDGKTKLAILPILSFPSSDKVLYQFYAVGSKKIKHIKS